jgi:hypothetical protein
MKKAVQIVTIPLNKDSWSKGDIIINDEHTFIAIYNSEGFGDWQSQQLLVLSDDEIQGGDIVYDLVNNRVELIISVNKESEVCKFKGGAFDLKYTKKLIASYPQLEGTLPISKETVQTWIDAGTPKECNVDTENICLQTGISCGYPCNGDCDEKAYKEYVYDPQGNLPLKFPMSAYDGVDFEPIKPRNSKLIHNSIDKPSILTDKEIEEKSESEFLKRWQRWQYDYKGFKRWIEREFKAGFNQGYKQALKDLGHE